jgi:purine-binding chemotaxis protein CheW
MSTAGAGRGAVNWADLRGRLAEAAGASTGEPSPTARRRTLDERARALARPPDAPPPADTLTLVTLSMSGETWGVDARSVWDGFRVVGFAPLPGAAPPVVGVVPWRGSILTVLDLRPELGIPAGPPGELAFGVVVGQDAPTVGLLVDGVHDIVVLDPGDLRDPPQGVADERGIVRGVTPAAVLVLDVAPLLRPFT